MRVEDVLSLEEYDRRAPADWPHRIPNARSADLAERLGDCIYDYSRGGDPVPRPRVYGPENRATDLGGKNVLISRDFYYFGSRAIPLPDDLLPSATRPRGTRARPMPLILRGL